MTTKTFLMYAAAGLLTPTLLGGAADAGTTTKSTILIRPQVDTAPTANGRLRRTDSEQAGHEMPAFAMAGDGIHGYYYAMTTELPPLVAGGPVRRANHRVQLSMTPFVLQLKADGSGSVEAVSDQTKSMFVTDNDGDEYRNSHHPTAYAINATTQCVEYNYQPNGGGDTQRWIQCFDSMSGANLLSQTLLFAKQNDDAATAQSSTGTTLASVTGIDHNMVAWRGANGNGRDDGWLQSFKLSQTAAGMPVTLTKNFDVSLAPREERTRGLCTVSAADPNTAICTHTEGNNQPQRDGTWISAVDITPGKFTGADRQQAILWKEQLEGRKDIDGLRTYSMRAAHERVMTADASGKLVASDNLFFYSNDLRGNNNGNEKGGTVMRTMMGVIKADKAGMSYTMPLTDTATMLRGLGGTHLGMTIAMFGTKDGYKPGVMFLNGSHTGGYFAGQARAMTLEANNTFADGGMIATSAFDRHLYSNYLGNNPGNQGRNFHHGETILNPFVGQGSTDKYITLVATTGKPMEEVGMPEYKTTAYLTVIPVASACGAGGAGNGTGGGNGMGGGATCNDGTDPGNPDPTDPNDPAADPSDPGSSLGGCSTGGSATGFGAMFLGLAFLIRRRRSN